MFAVGDQFIQNFKIFVITFHFEKNDDLLRFMVSENEPKSLKKCPDGEIGFISSREEYVLHFSSKCNIIKFD